MVPPATWLILDHDSLPRRPNVQPFAILVLQYFVRLSFKCSRARGVGRTVVHLLRAVGIGKRPIAAFGNSDGDLRMLQVTAAGAQTHVHLVSPHLYAKCKWNGRRMRSAPVAKAQNRRNVVDHRLDPGGIDALRSPDGRDRNACFFPWSQRRDRPTARTDPTAVGSDRCKRRRIRSGCQYEHPNSPNTLLPQMLVQAMPEQVVARKERASRSFTSLRTA
jgi:hypothetical protein